MKCEEVGETHLKNMLTLIYSFDYKTYAWKLVKTAKPKRKSNKSPILVVRRKFNYKNQHTGTEVDIKSKVLADVLIACNEDVEGLGLNKNPPCADPSVFYHSRHTLEEVLEEEEQKDAPDETLVADLQTAIAFTYTEYGSVISDMATLLPEEECTWDLFWALLRPSSLAYHHHQYTQQDQVVLYRSMHKMLRNDGQTWYWKIRADVVADNGHRFGIGKYPEALEIDHFEGARKIKDLILIPLVYTKREEELRSTLKERGRKYASLNNASYFEFGGMAIREERNNSWETKRFSFNVRHLNYLTSLRRSY